MTRLAVAALLTVAGITAITSHHDKRPSSGQSDTLATVHPLDRASRFEARRPLPGVEKPRRAPVRHVSASGSAPGSGALNWSALAACESSGDWHANTGNGYYGGLQFLLSTWRSFGGRGRPDRASEAEQIRVAERVLAVQGLRAWPACTEKLGWR